MKLKTNGHLTAKYTYCTTIFTQKTVFLVLTILEYR